MRPVHLVLLAVLFALLCSCSGATPAVRPESRVAVSSGFVQVDHGRLYYEITGAGEPVVLIHGNFGDRRYWDDQVTALATAHRVLRYDVRGFGKSSLPVEGVPYSDHADLAHLLEQLSMPSAHVVGFSMGAAIATDFALAYPASTKSLVSVGPWVTGYSSNTVEATVEGFVAIGSVVKVQGAAAAVDFALARTVLKETIRSPETKSRLKEVMKDFSWWYFNQEDPRLPLQPSAADRLDEIAAPTLIVTAEYDIPACLEFAELLDRRVRHSRKVTLARAGHFMMMEKPDAFNRALLDFFSGTAEASSEKPPVIDMHLHALPLDWFGPLPLSWAPAGLSIATSPEDLQRRTFAELEKNNVVRAATSGPLALVRAWKALDPERILAATIEAAVPQDFAEFRRLYTSGELQVIGEFGPQYAGQPASDQAFEPLFALAEELDVPIGVHMGIGPPGGPFECCRTFRAAAGDPLLLEPVIIRHPRLRLYMMHAGWPHLDHTIALMQLYPRVYADLSVINWYIPRPAFHDYLRRLVEAGLGERLMFGSDQMLWPEAITKGIEAIETATFLSVEQKRNILYNNAARFLRLEETR